jgi:hypothetical protein
VEKADSATTPHASILVAIFWPLYGATATALPLAGGGRDAWWSPPAAIGAREKEVGRHVTAVRPGRKKRERRKRCSSAEPVPVKASGGAPTSAVRAPPTRGD